MTNDEVVGMLIQATNYDGPNIVNLPEGTFKITRPMVFPRGVQINGAGPVGASGWGTILVPSFDIGTNAMFTWDGSDRRGARGTGGGMKNVTISKPVGSIGGTAIRCVAIDDSHRPGFMEFKRIIINGDHPTGQVAGTWDCGIEIDGMKCVTDQGMGVRNIYLQNVMVYACNDALRALNAVHLVASGFLAASAGGPTSPRVVISGGLAANQQSQDVHLDGLQVYGDLVLENVKDFTCRGRVSRLFLYQQADKGIVDIVCKNIGSVPQSPGTMGSVLLRMTK